MKASALNELMLTSIIRNSRFAGLCRQGVQAMRETGSILAQKNSTSDAAIDGLFAGLMAGAVMILAIMLGGLLSGESPTQVLERFSTRQTTTPLAGGLLHLAVSAIYGTFFSLLVHWLPRGLRKRLPGWLVGLFYGLLLLVAAVVFLLPGLRSPLVELPLWVLALGHSAYGLVLGLRL